MNEQQKQQVEDCVKWLEQGTLTGQRLRDTFEAVAASGDGKRQDLLYLQSNGMNIEWLALGMRLFVDGKWAPEPESQEDWPYKSVAEAISDGWRVIHFPNESLRLDENRTYGLGFEFVLERYR